MDLDDLFESRRNKHGNSRDYRYHDDDHHHDERYNPNPHYSSFHAPIRGSEHEKWIGMLDGIRTNKKLKVVVILAGILILGIVILLFIVFLPLIIKLVDYISQHGIQGIIDGIAAFLDRILKGSGK